ncbi:complement factor B-1-like protein [Dinothrombium tinctorium]|uniref:Complement factor B-1-like protein n=1 Tax=Dinothrombium tinctorium TaxID=1965070 RepID=A0A3S3P6Z5_9ACAR|nr:complement factor B-1-like protein [Dinothrombium tinctorium]RWS02405.1 complement factor B-1-like protein [Dinothrombium tinctorium]RWS02406.1 complement factor B-1-like protein [Dinothrombium tinctorium]
MTKAVLLLVALYSFPIAVYGMARDESCGSVIPLNGRVTAKEKYSYPSIASIRLFERYNKEYLQRKCVGSIISKRLILTTASCFTIKTRVVEVTLGSTDGKGHKIFSKNWELHKYYNAKNQSNDLAVIKLDGEIAFDKYTNPSCLSKIPLKETHENLKLIDLNEKLLPNGSIVGLFDVAKCKGNYPHPTNDKICVLIKKATSTFKFLHGKCGVINRRAKRIIYGNEVINPNFYPWMKRNKTFRNA